MSIVVAGWVAALLVFSSFFMKTMVPLRWIAMASNLAFIAYALLGLRYGVFGRVYPILVLHSALLPLNVLRLRQIKTLIDAVDRAGNSEVLTALIPYMTSERHAGGDVLFRKGDGADKLYVLAAGTVRLPDVGKTLTAGAVFGEVGLFAPNGTRSTTAVCEGDCRLYSIVKHRVLELFYQDPRFGFFLIRLVSGLVDDRPAAGASA